MVLGVLFGSETKIKKEIAYSPIIHQPFEVFSPAYQLDYSYAPSVFIESPGARGSVITTKKEATQTPYVGGSEIQQTQTDTEGWTSIILILGLVAVGGYVLVSHKKKKS